MKDLHSVLGVSKLNPTPDQIKESCVQGCSAPQEESKDKGQQENAFAAATFDMQQVCWAMREETILHDVWLHYKHSLESVSSCISNLQANQHHASFERIAA